VRQDTWRYTLALGGMALGFATFSLCAFSVWRCISYRTTACGLLLVDGGLWYCPASAISRGTTLLDWSWGRELGWHFGQRDEQSQWSFWPLMPGISTWPSGGHIIELPVGAVSLAIIAFSLAFLHARNRRRLAAGCCRTCGYDLRASIERCPECGEPVESGQVSGPAVAPEVLAAGQDSAKGLSVLTALFAARAYVLLCGMATQRPRSTSLHIGLVALVAVVLSLTLLHGAAHARMGAKLSLIAILVGMIAVAGWGSGVFLLFLSRLTESRDDWLLCGLEFGLGSVATTVLLLIWRAHRQRKSASVPKECDEADK
jgi:hypothetical protein